MHKEIRMRKPRAALKDYKCAICNSDIKAGRKAGQNGVVGGDQYYWFLIGSNPIQVCTDHTKADMISFMKEIRRAGFKSWEEKYGRKPRQKKAPRNKKHRIEVAKKIAGLVAEANMNGEALSATAIAKKIGTANSTVIRIARDAGIELPTHYTNDPKNRNHNEITRLMKDLVAKENPESPIYDQDFIDILGLNCSKRYVGILREKSGIPKRSERRKK